jgi:hypothetical protein
VYASAFVNLSRFLEWCLFKGLVHRVISSFARSNKTALVYNSAVKNFIGPASFLKIQRKKLLKILKSGLFFKVFNLTFCFLSCFIKIYGIVPRKHLCKTVTVFSFQRCLIFSGVEKMNNFDCQKPLSNR